MFFWSCSFKSGGWRVQAAPEREVFRFMIRAFFTALAILLCFALFESSILSNIQLLPAVPDFLLICSLYFSLNNGRTFGAVGGFCSGIFLDFLTAAPFGMHSLVRTIIGYSGGWFLKILNLEGVFIPALLGFSATVLKAFLLWLVSLFFPVSVAHYDILSVVFLCELAMNTIISPILFRFLRIFDGSLLFGQESVA